METEKKTAKTQTSIYRKIQAVRVELQKKEIKKSGKIGGKDEKPYLELADFINPLNELMLEQGFTAIATFTPETATLTAYDFDSDQTHTITSPMREAKVPNCNDMQNLGAVETYQRRYLYMAMFDVAESDILDGSLGKGAGQERKPKAADKPTPEQLKAAVDLKIDLARLAIYLKCQVAEISADDLAEAIEIKQKALAKQKAKADEQTPPPAQEEEQSNG